jgi:CBS domain containing-hemolysin-like protein
VTVLDLALGIFAIVMLTLGTGFFVAGEFSLVAVDRTRIERLAEQGSRRAGVVLAALRSLSFQLSGAQLGITLTSLLVGFIAEPTIGRSIQPLIEALGVPAPSSLGIAVALALLLATAVQMVIGELVPKNLALARPVALALWVAGPLRACTAALGPLIRMFNSAANLAVRAVGIEPRDELKSVSSLEELEILIRSSRAGGSLRAEEYSLLTRSISFGGKNAGDALVPRTAIQAVAQSDTLNDLVRRALDTGHSRFVVLGASIDDIVGVAHVKDVHGIPLEERGVTRVAEITQDALIVPESRPLESLLVQMRSERRQLALVIDEFGGTAGIITLEDILEEIVGDIEDEYDPSSAVRLTASPKGINVVSGMLRPDEVAEQTGFVMQEGDYETLAGFLLTLFDRIPDQGDHTSFEGWEFKVVAMDGRRIDKVLMVAPASEPEEQTRS